VVNKHHDHEQFNAFSSLVAAVVATEKRLAMSRETEVEAEVEEDLIAAVVAHAQAQVSKKREKEAAVTVKEHDSQGKCMNIFCFLIHYVPEIIHCCRSVWRSAGAI